MTQYVLTVVGDTNDADYITATNTINDVNTMELPALTASNGTVYQTIQGYTELEFIEALAKVLKLPRETRHNWTRFEYDRNDHPVRETIAMLAKELYNIDITLLDKDEDADNPEEYYESAFEVLREYVQKFLPSGEFGIHSVVSISYCPATQRTVLFGS